MWSPPAGLFPTWRRATWLTSGFSVAVQNQTCPSTSTTFPAARPAAPSCSPPRLSESTSTWRSPTWWLANTLSLNLSRCVFKHNMRRSILCDSLSVCGWNAAFGAIAQDIHFLIRCARIQRICKMLLDVFLSHFNANYLLSKQQNICWCRLNMFFKPTRCEFLLITCTLNL